MKIESAIIGRICDKCEQPILNKKGIALIDGENSKTYCQRCFALQKDCTHNFFADRHENPNILICEICGKEIEVEPENL